MRAVTVSLHILTGRPPRTTLFPYTTLCRSCRRPRRPGTSSTRRWVPRRRQDRKSTRLNSSHANISSAVFCLKTQIRHAGGYGESAHTDRETTANYTLSLHDALPILQASTEAGNFFHPEMGPEAPA